MAKEIAEHLTQENVFEMKILIFVSQFLMYSRSTC